MELSSLFDVNSWSHADNRFHHLTLYTYQFTSFHGWRVALTRSKHKFVRYFSVLEYGSEEAALLEAMKVRDALLHDLSTCNPYDEAAIIAIFKRHAAQKKVYPAGMRPPKRTAANTTRRQTPQPPLTLADLISLSETDKQPDSPSKNPE